MKPQISGYVRPRRVSDKIPALLLKKFSSREAFQSFDFKALLRRLDSASRRVIKVRVHNPVPKGKKAA
jgi:hypothetical protein